MAGEMSLIHEIRQRSLGQQGGELALTLSAETMVWSIPWAHHEAEPHAGKRILAKVPT